MKILTFPAVALLALVVGVVDPVSPAYAGTSCSVKETSGPWGSHPASDKGRNRDHYYEDCDTDMTKNLNGRVGQAAALGAALDSRIANPGERINLDLNWMTNDIGGAGAVGGSAFFNIPELDEYLYVGVRGGFGFEGQGALVGLGVSYAFSPF